MKTSREIAEEQIRLQEQIQSAGFNVVSCGRCGCVLIHKECETEIECFCGRIDLSDCSDLWYEGLQNNKEFNN